MLISDAREGMRVRVVVADYGDRMGDGEIVGIHKEMGLVSVRWDTGRVGEIDAAHIREVTS